MRILIILIMLFVGTEALATLPVTEPIAIYAGDDWAFSAELANTPVSPAFALNGYTCVAQVKRTWYDATPLVDLGCTVLNNRFNVKMNSATSSIYRGLNGVWDLILIDPSGNRLTIWHSPFKINLR